MAGSIKGITIKLGADITSLDKAIKDVQKGTRDLEKELKDVERLLKLDPSNVELLTQKQSLLNEAVKGSEDGYNALKGAMEKVEKAHAANADWERQFAPLKQALDDAKAKYGDLEEAKRKAEKAFAEGKMSAEDLENISEQCEEAKNKVKDCRDAVKDLEKTFADGHIDDREYRNYQRAVAESKKKTDDFKDALKKCAPELQSLGEKASDAGGKLSAAGEKMAPFSAAAAGIVGGIALAVESTQEYRSDLSKLETNAVRAGANLEITTNALRDLNAITGESDSNVEALSNLLQSGFTNNELQQAVDALSGAVISFPDTLKIESLADGLQETLATGQATGQFVELLERLGINTEKFDKNLQRATKSGTEQEFVLRTLAKTGLAQVNEQYRATNESLIENANAQFDLNDAMAELGEAAEPVVAEVTAALADLLGMFAEWVSKMDEGTLKIMTGFLLVVSAISPVLTAIGSLSTGIGTILPLISGIGTAASGAAGGAGLLSGALAALTSPVGLVVAAIGLLIAAFVYLWNNCEEFREFWIGLWEKIKETAESFSRWVVESILSIVMDFRALSKYLENVFATDWTNRFGAFGEVLNAFSDSCQEILDGIQEALRGVIDFIMGVFTGDWERAWEGVKSIFKGVFDALKGIVKAPLNGIIGYLNMAISGINELIEGLNGIEFDVPDWVPSLGGKSFGFDIPTIPKIPTLARGGILSEGQAIVAEAGPELIRMMHGRTIVTPLTAQARNESFSAAPHITETNYNFGQGSVVVDPKSIKDLEGFAQVMERERNRRQDTQMGVSRRRVR